VWPNTTASGTGHRPQKLGGFGRYTTTKLRSIAINALDAVRPKKVITGMALGWDTALAEAALKLHIPYIAAIPFVGQESRWQTTQQDHYFDLLAAAEDVAVEAARETGPIASQVLTPAAEALGEAVHGPKKESGRGRRKTTRRRSR